MRRKGGGVLCVGPCRRREDVLAGARLRPVLLGEARASKRLSRSRATATGRNSSSSSSDNDNHKRRTTTTTMTTTATTTTTTSTTATVFFGSRCLKDVFWVFCFCMVLQCSLDSIFLGKLPFSLSSSRKSYVYL